MVVDALPVVVLVTDALVVDASALCVLGIDALAAEVLAEALAVAALVVAVLVVGALAVERREADFFSGASRTSASHSAKVKLVDSRPLGIRAFFLPSVM